MAKYSKYKRDDHAVIIAGQPVIISLTALIEFSSHKYSLKWFDWSFHKCEPVLAKLLAEESIAGVKILRELMDESVNQDIQDNLAPYYNYGTIQGLHTYTVESDRQSGSDNREPE